MMTFPSSQCSNRRWKSALIVLIGFYTVLISSSNNAVVATAATPVLVAQQASSRTPQARMGQLNQNSPVLEDDGTYYETHTFEGNAGEALTIELTSNDFDAFLILLSPTGEDIAADDDGAGGTNARIVTTLPITGTYTIVAISYQAGASGDYQLAWRGATTADQELALATQLNQQAFELYQAGRYAEAEPLLQRSLAIKEEQLGPDHPDTADSLNNLALLYESMGRYAEAEPLLQRSLAVKEEQLGPDHPDMATNLNNLAALYESMGRYPEAEPLLQRSLAILEAQPGQQHPNMADSLNNLATLYFSMGRYAEAEMLYQRSLAITETQLGPNHPDTALSLNNLAQLYKAMGRYAEADPLFQRSLAIREAQLRPDHPSTASSLNNLAGLYRSMGRYAEAEPLLKRALAIREEQLGPNHPDTALSLNNLAQLYASIGRYAEADPLFQRSLAIREAQLRPDHPSTASSLNNLAGLYRSMGRYAEAEPLLKQSLSIREAKLGPEHPDVAENLNNLATLYRLMGRYVEAGPLLQRSLDILEAQLGSDHPDMATNLNNLAGLYESMGRYADAEPLYQRSLAILEAKLDPQHPATANVLNNLAGLYLSMDRHAEAEPLYQQSLAILEAQLGPGHPNTALSLNNLAGLYRSMDRYTEAEPLYQRALAIFEVQLGPEHPSTAASLNNLATLYHSMSRYAEAESLFQKALFIIETQLGLNHPYTASSLNNLATLYWAQGHLQPTFNYLQRGLTVEETVLSRNFVVGSDTNKRDYLATFADNIDTAISLYLNDLPTNVEAAQLALTTILQRKGRILDLFTKLRDQLADDSTVVALLDDLTAASTQLANLTDNPAPDLSPDDYTAQLNRLQLQVDTLENQLSRRSEEFAELTTSPRLADIQTSLPNDTALIEFIRYRPFNPSAPPKERYAPTHYAAFLLFPDGTIQGMDLGPAGAIDTAVGTLIDNLASPDTPKFQIKEDAQALDALVMAPVRQALGDTTTVFLSPDGALNLVPFEVLVDENNNYLVERYQFRYLTSGRDLMRIDNTTASDNPAVLMGDPAFGRSREITVSTAKSTNRLDTNIFSSLPGTSLEVEGIAQQFSDAQVYLTTAATEAQLKTVQQPSILHLATHGFFRATEETLNPLLKSGLVLAGVAERQSGPDEDGILYALEVTGLDLRGTQLVVLSACETGLGELFSVSEGLYGLRRALVLAGSQSQVISLWKVDDTATQELMVEYYKKLQNGTPRDQALTETQREFLQDPEYDHPYYWSAFVGSGDWSPLQP